MNFRGQDAWRRHPLFLNLWKNPFPGFKPAIVVFSAMVGAEYAFKYITLGPPPKKASQH
jgi:NADH-ubiquinone oxidoreductase B12 subunit family.